MVVTLTLPTPHTPGKLELMRDTAADVVGLDWAVDMKDARATLGHGVKVQVRGAKGAIGVTFRDPGGTGGGRGG